MPSGYQTPVDQLQPDFYRVTIDTSSATFFPTADGNDNGGITPNSWDSFATLPTTLVKGKARARGNMRFRNIVNALTGLADCHLMDVTITEANGDAQATTISFSVRYDRDTFIPLTGAVIGSTTVGNDINNAAMDTTAKVIKNAIAQGIRASTTASARVYDGTQGTQIPVTVTATAQTAAQTLGVITCTLIDTVTVVNA
jgi:hypothetical protein